MTADTVVVRDSRRARVLVLLAVTCAVLLAVLYVLAVRTSWGQRLGDAALGGRAVDRPRVQRAMDELLDTISITSVAMLGLAIVGIAVVRLRLRLAFAAGVVLLGANVTTQALKHVILTRPHLIEGSALPGGNSFPSGHATVAMSLAVALILVVPMRLRGLAALLGVGYATLVGMAVLGAGWHRPSDAVGAYLVVIAWAAGVAAVLLYAHRGQVRPRPHRDAPVVPPMLAVAGLLVLAVAFALLAGLLLALHRGRLDAVDIDVAYVTGSAAIGGAGLVLAGILLLALRGVDLDLPEEGPADVPVGAASA